MKRLLEVRRVSLFLSLFSVTAGPVLPAAAPPPETAVQAFERFAGLAGEWEGKSTKGWTERLRFQVIAKGSAVLETSFEAHPGETMATLFSLDAGNLELRHYCVAGNQPHLRATLFEEEGRRITFTFVDGGNLASRDRGHMDKAVFLFEDADHVIARWTWYQDGKERWLEEIRLVRKTVTETSLAGPASGREGERETVRRFLARRDETSFRLLYRAHTPFLYALALRLSGGRRFDAEDIVQETWVRAVSGLAGFRWESALSTWLCGIAVRCFREQARMRREEPRPERDPPPASSNGAEPDIDLERGVAAPAPGYREVLLLHDLHGYSHEEIGNLLGIDSGTSKSQLSRARGVLREWIGRGAACRGEEGRK